MLMQVSASSLKLFLLSFIMIFVASCESNVDNYVDEVDPGNKNITKGDIQIIKNLGFNENDVIDLDSCYLVEGDILLYKEHLNEYAKPANYLDTSRLKQARTEGLITNSKEMGITISIKDMVVSHNRWANALKEAINEWNNIQGCNVYFKLVPYGTSGCNIIVTPNTENLPQNVLAAAESPKNGNIGYRIQINLGYSNFTSVSDSQMKYNLVHELGHCLGLRHTNWQNIGESGGITIPGTPTSDNASVMNGNTANNSWQGFSTYDIVAIKTLYPSLKILLKTDCIACNNDNVSYSIDRSLPSGVTINWKTEGEGTLTLVSGEGTPNVTFKASGNGRSIVKADVLYNGGGSYPSNSEVWIGAPNAVTYLSGFNTEFNPNTTYPFSAPLRDEVEIYKWIISGNAKKYVNHVPAAKDFNMMVTTGASTTPFTVSVVAENKCGASSSFTQSGVVKKYTGGPIGGIDNNLSTKAM